MSKFKIGDKVVECETGDVGVITRMNLTSSDNVMGIAWYVNWERFGDEEWLYECDMDFYKKPTSTKVTQEEITLVHDVIEYNGHLYKLIGKSF